MRFMYGAAYNDKLLEWAALHGKTFDFRAPENGARTIGVVLNNKLVAVCIYHHFRPGVPDIEMTILAETPRWCTREAVRFLLRYPFLQLGCVRVTALIGRKNKRSRRLVEGLGWKLEGTARKAWDGRQDCMVYGLLRDECRWLSDNEVKDDGQEERRVA
jgi:RimJ/RimL family protein N-acetyltransferase